MDRKEIDQKVAQTNEQIATLQEVTPESASDRGAIARYVSTAKRALASLKTLQRALAESSEDDDTVDLEDQIVELRDSLSTASELLFKQLHRKLINDAAIASLEQTLLGLDALYAAIYSDES